MDSRLESLIRDALEAEAFERDALRPVDEIGVARGADGRENFSAYPRLSGASGKPASLSHWRRWGIGVSAAAACALAWIGSPREVLSPPTGRELASNAPEVALVPDNSMTEARIAAGDGGVNPSPVGRGLDSVNEADEYAGGVASAASLRSESLLALVRAWSRDCECLTWEAHHWQSEADPVRLAARDDIELGFDATEVPPEGQFVLVSLSAAEPAGRNSEVARELLSCLNATDPHADLTETVECSARTVAECLPEGARVLAAAHVRD